MTAIPKPHASQVDSLPYFRVFNPVLQSRKFDSAGEHIHTWMPGLSGLPAAAILAPWEKALNLPGYPCRPLVDHAQAAGLARSVYQVTKGKDHKKESL
jgi:deoxyribodipyrimidine photo-lyase